MDPAIVFLILMAILISPFILMGVAMVIEAIKN